MKNQPYNRQKRHRAYEAWRISNPRLQPRPPLETEEGRLCSVCERRCPRSCFTTDRRNADGLSRRCNECADRNIKRWRGDNPEHVREKGRRQQRQWRAENPDQAKSLQLAHKYGITIETFRELLASQNGLCAICSAEMILGGNSAYRICVDHDHETGSVRGLLCNNCNTGIGFLQEDAEILEKAISYIGRHR